MKKLLTFGHVFVNSLISPQYYQKLVHTKAWFSWQYFLFLNFLLSFVVLVHVLPALVAFEVKPIADELVEVFPAGLVVSGDTTGLHINQELPYSVPLPDSLQDMSDSQDPSVESDPYNQEVEFNLITFSTDELIQNVQDFYATNSLIVVTDTTIYALKDADSGEVRLYEMPAFEEAFSVSRQDLENFAGRVISHPFFASKWYVPLIGLAAVVLTLPLSIWLRTLAVAVYSAFVWVIVAFFMKSKKLSYGKLFQLGLHSLTLPLLIKIVVDYFMWFDFSGFWFMLAYLVWTCFLVSQITTDEVTHQVVAAPKKKVSSSSKPKTKKASK